MGPTALDLPYRRIGEGAALVVALCNRNGLPLHTATKRNRRS